MREFPEKLTTEKEHPEGGGTIAWAGVPDVREKGKPESELIPDISFRPCDQSPHTAMPLSSRWAVRLLSNCEPESESKSTPSKQPLSVTLYSNKKVIPSGEIRSSVLTMLNLRHRLH